MTLNEAIKHCEEVAEEQEKLCKVNDSFNFSQPKWKKCAEEHRQLAEWLKELKAYKEQQYCYNPDEWCHDCKEYDQDKHCCPRFNKVIRNTVKEIKQSKTGYWIPISEILPDEFADVLCNTDSEEIFIATYLGKMNDGTDCFDDHDGMMWEGNVIAWMPLPESYEPQESKE